MATYNPLILHNREISLPKAVVSADLGASTVLTNEPWDFVDLYLTRKGLTDARFYWRQSREFYDISLGLSQISAPLPLYYAFLNATKALLAAKAIAWVEGHGVFEWVPQNSSLLNLSKGVTIKNWGVAHSLSQYYHESETIRQHTLKDIFFNLPFIHRTFSLTNEPLQEMFIPVVSPRLVHEVGTTNAHLMAHVTSNFPNARYCSGLPTSLIQLVAPYEGYILSADSVSVSSVSEPTDADRQLLCQLLTRLREDIVYINGVDTLWYIKALPTQGGARLRRQTTTLTLAAMHRLSEESRYHPMKLAECLEGENNWLVSEFIKMSGVQFIDEIASEITGKQCLRPNVRAAK